MLLRSMLFVPGDSETKLANSRRVAADALILDLEDAVAPARKSLARALVCDFLTRRADLSAASVWVRVNPLNAPESVAELAEVMAGRPDGIVLPKTASPQDVAQLAAQLETLERSVGLAAGATAIMPIVTETPASLLGLHGYAGGHPRVIAMSWGAEDLALALGASSNVDSNGEWLFTYQLARALCLLAAGAAGAAAIDTVDTRLGDGEALRKRAVEARRDGFVGKLAIHPQQVEIINDSFRPTAEEIDHARRVVETFAGGSAGAIALDGRMLDLPHLRQAQHVLALADRIERAVQRG